MKSAIQALLSEQRLDGLLLTSKISRRYVSGFSGSDGLLLLTKTHAVLYVDSRYTLQAQSEAPDFEVIEYQSDPYALIAQNNLSSLGFEDAHVTCASYKKMKEALPKVSFHPFSKSLEQLRMIKTADELSKIRKAASIADLAFSHILKTVHPGMKEMDVALALETCMRQNGAQGVSFETIALCDPRSALPHGEPTYTPITAGNFLLMDYGCVYQGYCSDMTRTIAIGSIDQRKADLYQSVLKAQIAGVSAIHPGVSCADVDQVVRTSLEQDGLARYFGHATGHGVGLYIHEDPRLSPKSDQTLQEHMVVTVEPGIYLANDCGIRIEDLVAVTLDGCEIFSKSDKNLIII